MDSAHFELHSQIEERHWWFTARRKILSQLVNQILVPTVDSTNPLSQAKHAAKPLIVDIGCGTGANLATFANDYRCVGIDTSPEAISLAKSRYPKTEFVHGYAPDDIVELLHEAKLITLNDVLEHVRDDFLLLSRILGELRPGAFCLLTVPADLSLWSEHDVSFGHYRRYDRTRLELLWRDLPIRARLVSHFNTRLYPVIKTIRTLNRWRGKSGGTAGTDFRMPPQPVNCMLESLFAGEGEKLRRAMNGQTKGYNHGASLVAVLERLPGRIQARCKPSIAGRDYFDPELHQYVAEQETNRISV